VRKHNLRALRYVVAGVPQEPFLFAASIRENIAYRREGATDALLKKTLTVTFSKLAGTVLNRLD
jgi:ATP-binding cassette subfamily B (MDR/TAP) protein 1